MKKRAVRLIGLGLTCLCLAACSGGTEQNQGLFETAFRQITQSGLFNRNPDQPARFTATRASLREAGITQPVLVAQFESTGTHVGLLEFRNTRGVTVWRSLDGNTISTAGGALRNTRGFSFDLYSLETAPLERALASGHEAVEYSRLHRGLDGENQLVVRRLYCQLTQEGAENVVILGRQYMTTRFQERCQVNGQDRPVFENTYWQGQGGIIWRSRQWVGPDLGYAALERVIN